MPSASTSTTRTGNGARPGHARTSPQAAAFAPITPSTSHERRIGCRCARTPITGPAAMPVSTNTVSNALAVDRGNPSPAIRNGKPHISAKTVPVNWVV